MDFRGHLRLPDDAGSGIPVTLRIDDIFVIIRSGDEELGAWRADDVVIERIFSNQFALELAGEPMVFIASDALGFAYEGVSAIEDLQARLTKRRVFRRKKKTDVAVAESAGAPAEEVTVEEPPTAPPVSPVPEPAAEPRLQPEPEPEAPMFEPRPIWTPPSRVEPAARAAGTEEAPIVLPRHPAGEPAPPPADERVAYPRRTAGQPLSPPPAPPPVAHPAATREPLPVFEPPLSRPPAAPPQAAEPDPDVSMAPEYEIEEVEAAASGAVWATEPALPEVPAVAEVEIEIEDYVLPAAGHVAAFTPPPVEPVEQAPAPPEVPAAQPVEATEAEFTTEAAVDEVVFEEPVEAVSANGHRQVEELEVADADDARPTRKHSLFGRARDKKVPPHEHAYGAPKTIGGLTRSVCEVCGHVTFSGHDVYQEW